MLVAYRQKPVAARTVGFSLLELLVVIAILGVLIAILVPTFEGIRDDAEDDACFANHRTMGIGLNAYIADHGVYPGCHDRRGREWNPAIATWPSRMRAYTGRYETYNCTRAPEETYWKEDIGGPGSEFADADEVRIYGYQLGERLLKVDRVPFSYGYNDWGAGVNRCNPRESQRGAGSDLWDYPPVKFTQIFNPPDFFVIMCTAEPDGSWDFNVDPYNHREAPGGHHDGGCNIVYGDGHAGWLHKDDVFRPNGNTPQGKVILSKWNNHNRPTRDHGSTWAP